MPAILIVLLIALAVVTLVYTVNHSVQSVNAVPRPQSLSGEYSTDGENWMPIPESLKYTGSDIWFRGTLPYFTFPGSSVFLYLDHCFADVYINGEMVSNGIIDYEKALNDLCCSSWFYFSSPGTEEDDVFEFHLHSPHSFSEIRDFSYSLNNIYVGPSDMVSGYLSNLETFPTYAGLFIIIISLVLLGVAIMWILTESSINSTLWILSAGALFMGCYILLDSYSIHLLSDHVILTTLGLHICRLLSFLLLSWYTSENLEGRPNFFARIITCAIGLWTALSLIAILTGSVTVCDAEYMSNIVIFITAPLLLICCADQRFRNSHTSFWRCLASIIMLSAVVIDLINYMNLFWRHGFVTKLTFIILFLIYLSYALITVPTNQRAANQAKALERELKENRISIMLSQIQPHFIFNTLSSICYLCDEDPSAVKGAILKFASYLRGNLSSLDRKTVIPFDEELRHVQVYLDLEKLRFENDLNIEYDIKTTGFFLPALTVQPIVENAVKHGISTKPGGGTVSISTEDRDDCFAVVVRDDGVGFDPSAPYDTSRDHVGLSNVRSRLYSMCGGSLDIESSPGKGTVSTISIPKGVSR